MLIPTLSLSNVFSSPKEQKPSLCAHHSKGNVPHHHVLLHVPHWWYWNFRMQSINQTLEQSELMKGKAHPTLCA
eukprot:5266406-Amphidinium_carterae.1